MCRALLSRFVPALLVLLGGTEALSSDYTAAAMAAAALIGELIMSRRRTKAAAQAVARAASLPGGHVDDAELLAALLRAGVSSAMIERALSRTGCKPPGQ